MMKRNLYEFLNCWFKNEKGFFLQLFHFEKRVSILQTRRKTEPLYRARPGFEPGTSRTRSENRTPRPTSHMEPDLYHDKFPSRIMIDSLKKLLRLYLKQ